MLMNEAELTTFIIPSIGRKTLNRAVDSVEKHGWKYLVGFDEHRRGAGVTRNRLIEQATTEWVSMLDDDDTIMCDYVERLAEEIAKHPNAAVIHFREYFLRGSMLPAWPKVEWGNIGIPFSVRRDIALKHPFKAEPYEDFEFVKRLHLEGYEIVFSQYLTYRARH